MSDPGSISLSAINASFDRYAENQFSAVYKLEAWCPTADLLALVSSENRLELFRLSWNQHWSMPVQRDIVSGNASTIPRYGSGTLPQGLRTAATTSTAGSAHADVVSLVWRPDGKMIAVGLDNGYVNVYDYRDGSVVFTLANLSGSPRSDLDSTLKMSSVHCLKWTDIYLGRSNQSSFFGTHRSFKTILEALPRLSPVPHSSRQQQMLAVLAKHKTLLQDKARGIEIAAVVPDDVDEKHEEGSEVMNVLFAGDNCGEFRLRLFGAFDVKSVSLLSLMEAYGIRDLKALDILDADIQLDLSELVIMALGMQHHDQASSMEKRILRITLTSDLLEKHSREIRVLALKKQVVYGLLKYLSDSFRTMQADYKEIIRMVEGCVEKVQQLLDDNGATTTPAYEFMQLLMTGRPSPSIDQYLQSELGRQGLKSWVSTSKAAYTNIHKVTFECLLPGCERLLIHLSDILGCSRWTDQYKILQLEEAQVYNCIKITGDFVGLVERLFLAMKLEIKNFFEFGNWLKHVLDVLHPAVRVPDDQGEEEKQQPVDILAVSEFLKSGLNNEGLKAFFKEADDASTSYSDVESSSPHGTSNSRLLVDITDEDVNALGYRSAPSYPIVFSFSDELMAVAGAVTTGVTNAKHQAVQHLGFSPAPTQPAQLRKDTNPFAGPAIAAALAGRGFGPLSSKKTTTLNPQQSQMGDIPSATCDAQPTAKKQQLQLTLEAHLNLMTRQCQAIFEGPEEAVTKSMKVVHTLRLLAPDPDLTEWNASGSMREGAEVAMNMHMNMNMNNDLDKHPKLVTRYCYHDTTPWHYLVIPLSPSNTTTEPLLCVLRVRQRPLRNILGSSISVRVDETNDSTGLHQIDTSGTLDPKVGQKRRRVSDTKEHSTTPAVSLLPHKTWRKSSHSLDSRETPHTIESLAIQSPSQAFGVNKGDCASLAENTRGSEKENPLQSSDQDIQVLFFSLRDQGEEDSSAGRSNSVKHSSFYSIRDVTFLDDDHLGMILSSSSRRACGTASTSSPAESSPSMNTATSYATEGATATMQANHQEQLLVSIPLQSSNCPYQELASCLPEISLSGIESLGSMASPCLLDELTTHLETGLAQKNGADPGAGTSSTGTGNNTRAGRGLNPRLILHALPITRSRRIPYTAGQYATTGPCRIASNEREMKRLLSVHGLCSIMPKSTSQPMLKKSHQDIGTHITVFEL